MDARRSYIVPCACALLASVKNAGGTESVNYDTAWKELTRVSVEGKRVGVNLHRLQVGWTGSAEVDLKIELRTTARPSAIGYRRGMPGYQLFPDG